MFFERIRKIHNPEGVSCTPIVDYDKCSGCQRCYLVCPAGAYEWVDKRPKPVFAMDFGEGGPQSPCMGCRDCIASCSENAITIQGSLIITKGAYRTPFQHREIRSPQPLGPGRDYEDVVDELTEIEKVIYRRRSNRAFKKKPVPRELIQRIVEAARYAPTAGNCQPVRFIVIEDRALINEIRDSVVRILDMLQKSYVEGNAVIRFFLRIYGLFKPGEIDIRPIYGARAFVDPNNKLDLFHHAPCLILVLGDRRGVGKYQLDCGIASEHIVLTAHSLGLGSCYVGLIEPINLIPGLLKKLGVEYPYKVVSSIVLGYPKFKQDREVPREVTPIKWFHSRTPIPEKAGRDIEGEEEE